jgi:hypothetical protein
MIYLISEEFTIELISSRLKNKLKKLEETGIKHTKRRKKKKKKFDIKN